jgi:hypothetical protein
MDWNLAIGTVGTAASVASLLIAQPNWKSRIIHVVYSASLVIVIFLMTTHSARITAELSETRQKYARLASVQIQAKDLLATMHTFSTDAGDNKGQVLKALAFLERHRSELPETYGTVQRLAEGAGLTVAAKPYFEGGREQQDSLRYAGSAVWGIIQGLAVGPKS